MRGAALGRGAASGRLLAVGPALANRATGGAASSGRAGRATSIPNKTAAVRKVEKVNIGCRKEGEKSSVLPGPQRSRSSMKQT